MGRYKVWDGTERSLRPLQIYPTDFCCAYKQPTNSATLGPKSKLSIWHFFSTSTWVCSFTPSSTTFLLFASGFKEVSFLLLVLLPCTGLLWRDQAGPPTLSPGASLLSKTGRCRGLIFSFLFRRRHRDVPCFSFASCYCGTRSLSRHGRHCPLRSVLCPPPCGRQQRRRWLARAACKRSVAMSHEWWRQTAGHSSSSFHCSWSASVRLIVLFFFPFVCSSKQRLWNFIRKKTLPNLIG